MHKWIRLFSIARIARCRNDTLCEIPGDPGAGQADHLHLYGALLIRRKDKLHEPDERIDHEQRCDNGLKQYDILKGRHWMLHVRKTCHRLFCRDRISLPSIVRI